MSNAEFCDKVETAIRLLDLCEGSESLVVVDLVQRWDWGEEDSGEEDSGEEDSGEEDSGEEDSGEEDSGEEDSGGLDTRYKNNIIMLLNLYCRAEKWQTLKGFVISGIEEYVESLRAL